MRISDLSRESGTPIPTIKFYLREGILPPGRLTARNQAIYDEGHLRRLRLVRVLAEVGGMSLGAIRRVAEALAEDDLPLIDLLGVAHRALEEDAAVVDLAGTRHEVDAWLDRLGWQVSADAPARVGLAAALHALRRLGWEVGSEVFRRYAEHADAIAEDELAYVASRASREEAVEATVIGTIVFERALVALRRLAQEHHSRRRLG